MRFRQHLVQLGLPRIEFQLYTLFILPFLWNIEVDPYPMIRPGRPESLSFAERFIVFPPSFIKRRLRSTGSMPDFHLYMFLRVSPSCREFKG